MQLSTLLCLADENYTTRLSDVISVTVPAGQTAASVTMKDVDLSSIKQQNNANNVYLLETDARATGFRITHRNIPIM